ncbi:MAG: ATP-binding protein [Planctomycetota bacterium]|jgi:hypothetical protein
MKKAKKNPTELLKRAVKVPGGITASDYRKFRILFAKGNDVRIFANLESSIASREFYQELNTNPFNNPGRMQGNIILGKNLGGVSRYNSRYAPSHLLGIGATGVGKTVFLVFLLLQYLSIAKGMWIFDFIKRELRGFKRLAERAGKPAVVCRHEMLRINLLDPQGTDPTLYANTCAEFITLSLNLPPVAKLILKICITHLYQRSGVLINSNAEPPILSELINEVRRFEGNKSSKEAILIRLEALIINKRQTFNVRRGMPIHELARKYIVWEFDGLETQYQNLFVSYLLSMLFLHRVENRTRDLIVVALDEASRLYSKKAEATNEGPSYISTMTSVIRKMFIALFVWTQSCKDLSYSIIANSGIKVLCRVGLADDYDAFGRSMGLTSKQIQYCKTNLDIGSQVIKMGFGWLEPFLNQSPLINIPEDVTDAEVRQSAQSLLNMVPKPPVQRLLLPEHCQQTKPADSREILPSNEKSLYEQILHNLEIASATERYHMAGLTAKQGIAAKKSLIKKNLIKETPVESGRRARAQLFLEVINKNAGGRLGKGLHNYLRNKARAWYIRQGCITESEKGFVIDDRQIFVDLAVTWPDRRTEAIEVETADSNRAIENIRKNIAAGFSAISVLAPNRKVRDALKKRVAEQIETGYRGWIKFPSISFYD